MAVEGAILIESNSYKFFDELWVLKLDKQTAFERVKKRNPNLSETEINNRLERQITDEDRLKYATWSYDTAEAWEVNQAKVDQRLKQII